MEVEAKFAVRDAVVLAQLIELTELAGYAVESGEARDDRDTFLDTAGGDVLAAGFYLRLREAAGGARLTLKQLSAPTGGVLRREEMEEPVAAGSSRASWPEGPLRERIDALTGGQPLEPLLTLAQRRYARRVVRDGHEVAELSLDRVVFTGADRERVWYEAEVELRGLGSDDDLAALADALHARDGLRPTGHAKFARALGIAASAADASPALRRACAAVLGGPSGAESMTEVAVGVLRLHFARMLAHEEGTRRGDDPEELHKMRVATRRMRMALRVFADYLDRRAVHPVLKGLRHTGRALGVVRDLDVFYAKAQVYCAGLPAERSADLDGLLRAWRVEYAERRRDLLSYLDSRAYARFVERTAALLEVPPERIAPLRGARPYTVRVSCALPGLLRRELKEVVAFEGRLSDHETPLPLFHDLRRSCKRLRYTLEFFDEAVGLGAEALVDRVKLLQDNLGDLQDGVVACGLLRDYLTWGSWRRADAAAPGSTEVVLAPGVARYLCAQQEGMDRLVHEFSQVWSPVRDQGFRRELEGVVTECTESCILHSPIVEEKGMEVR